MSYNIDNCETLLNDNFRIKGSQLKKAIEELTHDGPERSFLSDLPDPSSKNSGWKANTWYFIDTLEWSGEGSGHIYDSLLKIVLPKTMGSVEVIFTWEGGNSINGLRVKNGIVEECEVTLKLGKGKKVK